MVFNEILIPQDPFTETNVTRKRSIVGNSYLSQKNIFYSFTCYLYKKNHKSKKNSFITYICMFLIK